MSATKEEAKPLTGGNNKESKVVDFPLCVKVCGAVCCVLTVIFIVLYIVAINVLTDMAIGKFVTLNDTKVEEWTGPDVTQESLVYNNWWPGCGTVSSMDDFDGKCGEPCFSADLMEDVRAFNKEHPGKRVKYFSRDQEGVENVGLEGWWLPAPSGGESAPRIILQHGFTENSNTFRPFLAAYMLRKIGFSVLLNNFRDHGYSDKSSNHVYEWGDAYPYDLLGAWDYARMDPDGSLGGEMATEKVGIMGFSKGAFTTVNAFGLEGDVPAVWVDSPPFEPKVVFATGAAKELGGLAFVAPLIVDPVWDRVEDHAASFNVDINKNLPAEVLPAGPDKKRPIFVTSNINDGTVPIGEMDSLVALLETYPEKYSVDTWKNDGTCNGDNHCVDHLSNFEEYSKKLCEFWKPVFEMSKDSC
mmetsp:Transcript_147973/g.368771  ORF Transcript_147973/g.368771 Transcript_147973/m.368771 type:complete len:414 (-) Transcript_147973:75-1316(-)